MIPWNAIPWDIINQIIIISIIIPGLFAIVFIKLKRYEEFGVFVGIFLILMSTITYAYIIPNEIIQGAVLPEDYIWEDEGHLQYWERTGAFSSLRDNYETPGLLTQFLSRNEPIEIDIIAREVIHATAYDKERDVMTIQDALYDGQGELFAVIGDLEKASEWYQIDPHLTSLKFVNVDAGHMGIPINPEGVNIVKVGWVESSGEETGAESIVLVREMKRIQSGVIDGLEVDIWQSDVFNQEITWHGDNYVCDETLRFIVVPQTGYVIHVYRHLVLSAYLSQFLEIYYPNSLRFRSVNRFLEKYDPVGEAAELIYETTEESQARHIAAAQEMKDQITYIPMIVCFPLFIFGVALVWRYAGRSYYWKRYKEYDPGYSSSLSQEERLSYPPEGYEQYRRRHTKKRILTIAIGIILIVSSISLFVFIEGGPRISGDFFNFEDKVDPVVEEEEQPIPPGSSRPIDAGRHTLTPKDEGSHRLSRREWWYFNVYFNDPDSDLQNHSMIVSFNKMALNDIRFLKRDNLFIILYDDQGSYHDFTSLDNPRGTLKTGGPGIDVSFENSWVNGEYPNWQVHAESKNNDFVADFDFTADFLPVWVMGRSSNLPIAGHFAGDYYVPRCDVQGNITWNSQQYEVKGIGYYDHVWESFVPRFVTKGWEWFNLHFDNGWEMYLSKFILRTPRNRYAAALIISPDDRNIIEYKIINVDYIETATPDGLPLMEYPKVYHVTAERDNMVIDLEITMHNMCEITWKLGRTGMFEGPCSATGTFSWDDNTVELHGYGMAEITRVKYLLELPQILPKREPRYILYSLFERLTS